MTVKRSRFQSLANRLISKTFGDFQVLTTITTTTGFDYDTQEPTDETQEFYTIRMDYSVGQFDGQKIQIGDYMLVGELAKLDSVPSLTNTTVTRSGETCNLLRVEVDQADATITLYVRPQ